MIIKNIILYFQIIQIFLNFKVIIFSIKDYILKMACDLLK